MISIQLPTFTEILEASRHVNVNTLRWVSLTLMIISLTPLDSIYLLLHTMVWGGNNNTGDNDGTTCPANYSNQECQDTKALLWASLREVGWELLSETSTTPPARHWTAAIAWGLSMFVGVVVPIILYIFSWIRTWRWRQFKQDDYPAYKLQKKRRKLSQVLEKYTKILKEEDRVLEEETHNTTTTTQTGPSTSCSPTKDSSTVNNNNHCSRWIVPCVPCCPNGLDATEYSASSRHQTSSSDNDDNPPQFRTVGGMCAICLYNFEPNHKIVWSPNHPQCCHSFHLDCLLDWFVTPRRRRRKHHSSKYDHFCPCCRQVFVTQPPRKKRSDKLQKRVSM